MCAASSPSSPTAGSAKLEEAAPGHVATVREILVDVLTPGQLDALADGLGEVGRRLRGQGAQVGPDAYQVSKPDIGV